jgi:hypothetical protein
MAEHGDSHQVTRYRALVTVVSRHSVSVSAMRLLRRALSKAALFPSQSLR